MEKPSKVLFNIRVHKKYYFNFNSKFMLYLEALKDTNNLKSNYTSISTDQRPQHL